MIDVNNPMKYNATWWGITRISLWTAFFLTLLSIYLPVMPERMPFDTAPHNPRLRPVATISEDPRFILQLPRQEGLNIAWITDSSGAIFPPKKTIAEADYSETKLIPSQTLDKLQKLSRRQDIGIDLNIQPGLRALEHFSSVAAAIEAKPDLMVISVNPFWQFNGYEMHKRMAHLNRASVLWAQHPPTWPWLATLASPANNLWAALGRKFSVISEMGRYKGIGGRFVTAPVAATPKDRIQLIKSGVVFWACLGALQEECSKIILPGGKGIDNRLWYREMLKLSDTAGKGITGEIWQKELAMIAHSGIPALIYLAPVGADIKNDAQAYVKLQEVEAQLEAAAGIYDVNQIRIIPRLPPEVLRSMKFRPDDNAHVISSGTFDSYLAQQIWHILKPRTKAGKDG